MRRLLRWAFSGAAVLSALLFVATCALWVRSYISSDALMFTTRGSALKTYAIGSEHWRVVSLFSTMEFFGDANLLKDVYSRQIGGSQMTCTPARETPDLPSDTTLNKIGFMCDRQHLTLGQSEPKVEARYVFVSAPDWFLVLLTIPLPLRWLLVFARERRRLRLRLCRYCGYDLRATPDRCPECGAVPEVGPHNKLSSAQ